MGAHTDAMAIKSNRRNQLHCTTTITLCTYRLFAAKCAKCSQSFNKNDFVMRARNKIYHTDCFCCVVCSRQLVSGDEFALRDDGLFCKVSGRAVCVCVCICVRDVYRDYATLPEISHLTLRPRCRRITKCLTRVAAGLRSTQSSSYR